MNNLTNTVTIKPLTVNDTEIVYHLIDQSRADLKNLIWSQSATLESTNKFIECKNNTEDKVFGVFQDNSLVGVLELRKINGMCELGYWVGSQYRGQGLMKIAVKQLVDVEIKNNSIVAHIRETNKASDSILHYAGLKYDHTEVWQGENWIHVKRHKENK